MMNFKCACFRSSAELSVNWEERRYGKSEGHSPVRRDTGRFSVGPVQVPEVIKYIAAQKEHHRTISFQEKFISFLQKYRIEYDDRYIWK
jgi:hypothetical protein